MWLGTGSPDKSGIVTAAPFAQAGLGLRSTLHAIDSFHGTPTAGMVCDLPVREGEDHRPIKKVTAPANGRPAEPLRADDAPKIGQYERPIHGAASFWALGVPLPSPNFSGLVPIRFRIRDAGQRYHLPAPDRLLRPARGGRAGVKRRRCARP